MNSVNSYQNVQVMTADGVRLIILLYEGVIRFNNKAAMAIEQGDIEARTTFINKSTAIIAELSGSLNMEEGGEIAENLTRLYDYCGDALTMANRDNDPVHLRSVNRVIQELKSGWEGIAAQRDTQQPPAETDGRPRSVSHGA